MDARRQVAIVAALFYLSGGIAVLEMARQFGHGQIQINVGVVSFWIGTWLFRHEPRGRRWALFCVRLGLVLIIPCLTALWYDRDRLQWSVFGVPVARARWEEFLTIAAGSALLASWQHRVLTCPAVVTMFNSPETPSQFNAPSA